MATKSDDDHGHDHDNNEVLELLERLFSRPDSRQLLGALIPRLSPLAADNLRFVAQQSAAQPHSPSQPQPEPPQEPTSAGRKRRTLIRSSKATQWWARFHALSSVSLHSEVVSLIEEGSARAWLHTSYHLLPSLAPKTTTNAELYSARFIYMRRLESHSSLTTTLGIAHCLFFLIASHPDPQSWAARSRRNPVLLKLSTELAHQMYVGYSHMLGDDLTEVEFTNYLRSWRKKGSRYAYIARRLGLGSLLHLQSLVSPDTMWGASVGESYSSAQASEQAFRHLERLGLAEAARTSGADAWMHDCLWELCGRFPGFENRTHGAPFPGFDTDALEMESSRGLSQEGTKCNDSFES
jgi:hypothetical protein